MRKVPSGNPAGYGRADREMAKALDKANTQAAADRIARENGLKDADDARDWLRERA